MREFWQRKPALIRNAVPGWRPPVDRERLLRLARDSNVESRLIVRTAGRWSVRHGPFPRLPAARSAPWTLLVQGVDLMDEGAHELLSRFRFVSDARLDDLMASYATPGGGVGAHVDSYDVFLLQASGRRRWRISRQRDLELRADAPLRLLADFRPSAEWILEPGDLLYLPPGVAHEGVALDDCVTYSIGFRAPGFAELLEPWFTEWAENVALPGRYTDAGVAPTVHPAALPTDMTARVHQALTRRRPGRDDTERFLLRYLTEPKASVIFSRPRRSLSALPFARRADAHGLRLNRASRMLYARDAVAINGECHAVPKASRATVRRLADQRELAPGCLAAAAPALIVLLHDWYSAGWLSLQARPGNAR